MRVAVYDMAVQPVTFDCLVWLASVGAQIGDGPVQIAVLADQRRIATGKDKELSDGEWRWRVRNIVQPCMDLLPNAVSVARVDDRADADRWRARSNVSASTHIAALPKGSPSDLRRLRATPDALSRVGRRYDGAVVISLRINRIAEWKNASLSAWLPAAGHMRSLGHRVVLIPDAETILAGESLPSSGEWCIPAAINVGYRMAVYERAAAVLAHGIGPAGFNLFRDGRYALFVEHRNVKPERLREQWMKLCGVPWGSPLPFAGRGQSIEYRPDTEPAIREAFERMMA